MLSTFSVVGTNTPEMVPSFLDSSAERDRCPFLSFLSALESCRGAADNGTFGNTLSRLAPSSRWPSAPRGGHHRAMPWKRLVGNEWRWIFVMFNGSCEGDHVVGCAGDEPLRSSERPCAESDGARRKTSSSAVRVEKFGRRRDIESDDAPPCSVVMTRDGSFRVSRHTWHSG